MSKFIQKIIIAMAIIGFGFCVISIAFTYKLIDNEVYEVSVLGFFELYFSSFVLALLCIYSEHIKKFSIQKIKILKKIS